MPVAVRFWLEMLGPLRLGLLTIALLNMLVPIIDAQFVPSAAADAERSLWGVFASLITPVLAPLLMVVVLFDYIMTRVRAADASGEERSRFVTIGRIELAAIAIMLIYWVPALIALTS